MNLQTIPEETRRSIARVLSHHYHELAGNAPEDGPRFSFGRVITAMCTERGLADGYEKEICSSAAMIAGQRHDPHKVVIPFSAFTRDLTAASASGGGYLIATDKQRPVDILRSWSIAMRAGITVLDGLTGNPAIPRVLTASTAMWLTGEASNITQSEPTLGEAVATPKMAAGFQRYSRQLAIQGESFDRFTENQLLEGAAALIDQAVIAGTGAAGQPTGIINATGVGTQSGTSLSHAGTKTMRKQVIDAGGLEERISWVGASDVQDVLGGRQRFTGVDTAIWDNGRILGRPAAASKYAPNGSLIGGDWSRVVLCLWGTGMTVEIDPYTYFTTAKIQARIVVPCDVILVNASALTVATSVT